MNEIAPEEVQEDVQPIYDLEGLFEPEEEESSLIESAQKKNSEPPPLEFVRTPEDLKPLEPGTPEQIEEPKEQAEETEEKDGMEEKETVSESEKLPESARDILLLEITKDREVEGVNTALLDRVERVANGASMNLEDLAAANGYTEGKFSAALGNWLELESRRSRLVTLETRDIDEVMLDGIKAKYKGDPEEQKMQISYIKQMKREPQLRKTDITLLERQIESAVRAGKRARQMKEFVEELVMTSTQSSAPVDFGEPVPLGSIQSSTEQEEHEKEQKEELPEKQGLEPITSLLSEG